MNLELLKIIEGIARDKNLEPEVIIEELELAMISAIRKANSPESDIDVIINRKTGAISATVDGEAMNIRDLGRIAAQTAKQVMIQRIREAERGSIYDEFLDRKGHIVTGRVARWEGGALVIDLDRCEAYLPKAELIPGDSHKIDERIRAMIYDVREQPGQIKVILSRTHPDFIRALFLLEVPEVADGIIEVKALSREAGYRTKVAVHSVDPKVDAVGACVGIRGSRIKNIVDELGGEKIDIVRWNESSKTLIENALKPAEIAEIALCFELGRATVAVTEDQLSLAIGKRGQNVRLAARLTNWDIDILTPNEYNEALDTLEAAVLSVEGVDSTMFDQITALGMVSVLDVEEVGPEPLISELGFAPEIAQAVVLKCAEEAKRVSQAKGGKPAPAKTPTETPTETEPKIETLENQAQPAPQEDLNEAVSQVADEVAIEAQVEDAEQAQ